MTWSHYQFRSVLENKARRYRGAKVVVVDEAYTSKTCGRCGWIHARLGGSKTFRCSECGWVVDRDVNGARNSVLRALARSHVSESEVLA